jgi:glucose/arabinose dehydrogenase
MKFNIYLIIISLALGNQLEAQSLNLELFASGFNAPVDIAHAGDERLFVVERGGLIKIIASNGVVLPTPFLDIDEIVKNANNQSEQGLLGLTFHPDYKNNGYLYLHYIDNENNSNIVRYQVDQIDSNQVDANTRELILEVEQPFANHNGGCLKFGPDGYLYIGMGDGGSGNDPINSGQRTDTHLGKMLRIDVDNGLPYTIPDNNPFVDDENVLDEIWATGLRNPWRFSFDKETGDLWIGDVGQSSKEEIDYQKANSNGGENYGWRCFEGTEFSNLSSPNDCIGTFIEPVFEVAHQGFSGPCSITGGFVYRGTKYSEFIGKYICADYCTGDFYIVRLNEMNGWSGTEVGPFPHSVSTFGEDINGELYIASFSNGGIYKIVGETVSTANGIPELEKVLVFPNPTLGRTQLDLKTKGILDIKLQLIDVTGKVVFNKSLKINGTYTEFIDMDGFPSGTYILQISTDSGLLSKQLIVY